MAPESIGLPSTTVAKPIVLPGQGLEMGSKIVTAFSMVIIALGVAIIGLVYYFTRDALHKQMDYRAVAIATNLSDTAASQMVKKNFRELDTLIGKYRRLDGVAYAYIRSRNGEVLASSLQSLPSEIKESASANNQRAVSSRVLLLNEKSIHEAKVPILEGQLGTVHVGLWADSLRQDLRTTLIPVAALLAVCLTIGIVLSILITGNAMRPVAELTKLADEISRGHLDRVVSVQSRDEVGELARSLERMRASLKAAIARLSKADEVMSTELVKSQDRSLTQWRIFQP